MPQITNLNVAPYYDDFDKDDNFHRVLFRPGYAVQARELTTLQSIMQNQVEGFGRHMFQEGSMVIPGQLAYSTSVDNIQLASTFAGETLVPSQYYNATNPVVITGATSGVQAKVIGYQDATATTKKRKPNTKNQKPKPQTNNKEPKTKSQCKTKEAPPKI